MKDFLGENVKTAVKLTGSILIFSYVAWDTELYNVFDLITQIPIGYIGLVIAMGATNNIISSERWRLFLRAENIDVELTKAVKYYMIGNFFNSLIPSSFGGDIPQGISFYKHEEHKPRKVFRTIFCDRIFGLASLLALSILPLVLSINQIPMKYAIFLGLIYFTVVTLVIFLTTGYHRKLTRVLSKIDLVKRFKLRKMVRNASKGFSLYKNKDILLRAFILAIVFQISVVIIHIILSKALGLDIPILSFFVLLPISSLMLIIPISFQGLGYREAIYILLFSSVGSFQTEKLVTLGILINSISIFWSLAGGVIYWLHLHYSKR